MLIYLSLIHIYAIRRHVEANGGHFPADVDQKVDQVARQGATPLVVVEGSRVLGVIAVSYTHLDVYKRQGYWFCWWQRLR